MAICTAVEDCDKPAFRRGWCSMHYERWKTHGDFVTVKKPGNPRSLGNCAIDDGKGPCGRPAVAKDLCGKHYQRWAKFGDPLITKLDRDATPEERFWPRVDKNGPPPEYNPELGPCWLWTGGTAEGYGMFSSNGKQVKAHRVSYQWAAGEIPEDCEIDHLCRVRRCVNPLHLEPVSHLINVHRGVSPWAINAAKTHCPQNHEYTEENTYLYRGERHCRTCARERTNDWIRRTGWKSKARRNADQLRLLHREVPRGGVTARLGVRFESARQEWETPDELFRPLDAEFGFTLDAAANALNTKVPGCYFDEAADGLSQDWGRNVVWLNPPYGDKSRSLAAWVRKAAEAADAGVTCVLLIPARTNTNWFHDYCLARGEVRFIRGRPKFGNASHGLPLPLCVTVFRPRRTI